MNKIFIILFVILVNTSFAQNKSSKVDFKDVNLETAIRMAKEKKLSVFCNFSTSWCGPCKTMLANVYSNQEVGDIMNNQYISLYIDAESKEWVDIAKKFKIAGYPTMIILDETGTEKGRLVGAYSKSRLLSELEKLSDDKRSPDSVTASYNSGVRTPEIINDYAFIVMKGGDEKKGYEIINSYFNSLSDEQRVMKDNWFLFNLYSLSLNDVKAKFLIENYKKFYNTIGKDVVQAQVYKLLRSSIIEYVCGYWITESSFDKVEFDYNINLINNIDIEGKSTLLSYVRIAESRVKCVLKEGDSYSSFIKVCEDEFKNLDQIDSKIMVSDFSSLTLVASDRTKRRAIALIEKYKEKYNHKPNKFIDILANTISDLTPIKRGEIIDFKDISFDEALKLANKKDKLIFIDCYTDWCGPCKRLSEEVFTVEKIKKYFDENFINLKVDTEKGEGPSLAKKFKVKIYPTLLLVNQKGEVVYRETGLLDVEIFFTKFKDANEKFNSKN